MRRIRICFLLLILAVASLSASAQQDPASSVKTPDKPAKDTDRPGNINLPKAAENWSVTGDIKTGLNPRPPFLIQSDEQPDFVRDLVRLQWRDTDPIDVWVMRPKVAGKVPARVPGILYLYSYADTGDRFRDNEWCKRSTANGFAAVGFVSALTDYRFINKGLSKWFVSELPESLGSTTHDVQLILNFLQQRGDIDMSRVGMFGIGSGATIAILAAQVDPRISALDLLDPWGDWPDWFHNSAILTAEERPKYETKEFLGSVFALDPVAYFPALRTPKVRLQQMANDATTPSAAKERISAAAPLRATLVKYQSEKDLFAAWQLSGLSGWLKQQLRPQPAKGTVGDQDVAKNQ